MRGCLYTKVPSALFQRCCHPKSSSGFATSLAFASAEFSRAVLLLFNKTDDTRDRSTKALQLEGYHRGGWDSIRKKKAPGSVNLANQPEV